MLIAKIVKSNSHVDYVGRVIDPLDSNAPPDADDYGFAKFVALDTGRETIVGVIYNSLLFNPEYGNFGPRLSPREELAILSPDYLNEQGVLIGILLLGWIDENQNTHHGVPRRVVPVGCAVEKMSQQQVARFHTDARGRVQLHYYSQLIQHAREFGVSLLEVIISDLDSQVTESEKQRLCVLKKSLQWQRTMTGLRL